MTRDYDFNVVKCGKCKPANEWSPPFTSFTDSTNDERHNYADMIVSAFEECGADGAGIDNCFDNYEEEIGEHFDTDPIMSDPIFNTDAKKNGAKALAVNIANRYENKKIEDVIDFVKKVYAVEGIDPDAESTAPCYI